MDKTGAYYSPFTIHYSLFEAPVETQSAHAAVRVDAEERVRGRARLVQLRLVEVARVRLQARARQKLAPVGEGEVRLLGREALLWRLADFERTALGEVTFEVRRVHLDAPNRPARAEPYDAPVVAGAAPPLRLPAVAHVRGAAGH